MHIIVHTPIGTTALSDHATSYLWSVLNQGLYATQSISYRDTSFLDGFVTNFADGNNVKTHEFVANWANGNKAAGYEMDRHMVRTTLRRYGVNIEDDGSRYGVRVAVLLFTNGPLETDQAATQLHTYATKRGLKTMLFRLDTQTREF